MAVWKSILSTVLLDYYYNIYYTLLPAYTLLLSPFPRYFTTNEPIWN